MKTANFIKPGSISICCGLFAAVLSGCTTYVERAPVTYLPPPSEPPPPVVEPAPPVNVDVTVNIRTENDFYEPLSPYGRWVIVGGHGRCWVPSRVASDWRPYCNGYWQRTDAGWYWASDEPWGWATYHYGRWDFDSSFGWFWVPQTQWGPAWVSFHEGGGYVGWAPLPPAARVGPGGYVDVTIGRPPPRAFVFVEQRRFCEPVRPSNVVINNTTIINKTVNITKIKVVNNTVINEGPNTTVIERASGRRVQTVPAREMRRKLEAPVVAREPRTAPVVENTPPPPRQNPVEPQPSREPRAPRDIPNRQQPRTPPAREVQPAERPAVVKDTPAPAPRRAPENPGNVTAAPHTPPKTKEMKPAPRPAAQPASRPVVQNENRPGNARPPQDTVVNEQKEKPIKGRGADKQMKAAKETRQNKGPTKGPNRAKKQKEKDSEKSQGQPPATPP